VFAKSANEPINKCRELNESEKPDRKFLASGAEAPLVFETAEEVFDFTTRDTRSEDVEYRGEYESIVFRRSTA
jgi:hypothetical protein